MGSLIDKTKKKNVYSLFYFIFLKLFKKCTKHFFYETKGVHKHKYLLFSLFHVHAICLVTGEVFLSIKQHCKLCWLYVFGVNDDNLKFCTILYVVTNLKIELKNSQRLLLLEYCWNCGRLDYKCWRQRNPIGLTL